LFYEVVYVGVVDESREFICAYAVAEVMDVLGSVMCAVEPVVRYVVYGSTIGNFDVAGFVVCQNDNGGVTVFSCPSNCTRYRCIKCV